MLNPNGQCYPQRFTSSGLIKKGNGLLTGFIVASGTPTVKLYDGIDTSGTVMLNSMVCQPATPYPLSILFTAGCYVSITGTCDITFLYN